MAIFREYTMSRGGSVSGHLSETVWDHEYELHCIVTLYCCLVCIYIVSSLYCKFVAGFSVLARANPNPEIGEQLVHFFRVLVQSGKAPDN